MSHVTDEQARERIRNALDESMIVEAAAGTGKTTELVRRIVNVMRTGRARVDTVVAVTFTRKAAGELRLRLRVELDKARAATGDELELKRIEDALSKLEEAHIGTIHAFCAELLRQRPVEAHIPPGFEELSEAQAARLYNRAFDIWIQQALQTMSPAIRRAMTRLVWGNDLEGSPLDRLRAAGRTLVEWRDFPAAWRREPFDQRALIDRLVDETAEFGNMVRTCKDPRNTLRRDLQCVVDFMVRLRRTEESRPRDHDHLEALFVRLGYDLRHAKTKGRGKYSTEFNREVVLDAKERLLSNLTEFERRAGADLACHLQSELQSLVATYETLKAHAGKLDFVDLLIRTRNLLRDDTDVRAFMQKRFTHIFVDEFQDTDPVQAEILLLLSADDPQQTDWREVRPVPGKLFMVGDPKQSIYRFRRADIVMYQGLCRRLQQKGVGMEFLAKSFRAVRPIQQAVNAAFAPEMTGDDVTGQPAYVPLAEFSSSIAEQPAVIALPAPYPYGSRKLSNDAIEKCLPDTVGAFVDWLIRSSGWKVRDPLAAEPVAIASRHIAILFRRFMTFRPGSGSFEDVTRGYVNALEVRNIPHVLWGARSFHQREEVESVRAALNAIEWPDDDLSSYATLRGSLFAISDSLLLRFRKGPKEETNAPEFEPVRQALDLLHDLHRRRNRRSAVETVNELLEACRAHAGFALRPSGSQVLANVYRICDLARAYELSGGSSFRGFVEQLNAQSESEDSAEAPVLEDGADGVRIMTVHAAKGLEFPIVILADMTANIASRNPDKHVDNDRRLCATRVLSCAPWELIDHENEEHSRDAAEGVRVAYVAATRARDLLVVCAVGDEKRDGWLMPLNKALYPARENWRESASAPFCPALGEATVLRRPLELEGLSEASIKPGLAIPEAGEHRAVWWDPSRLELHVEPSFGLPQEEILIHDKEGLAEQSIAAYEDWKSQRHTTLSEAAKESIDVFIATDASEPPFGYAESVRLTRVSRPETRPKGPRFGTLVHLIMRDVPYDATPHAIEHIAMTHARLTAATEEEISAAVQAVSLCLKHPLVDLARGSNSVHRELPIVVKSDDGKLLDAVIDLAFRDQSGWVIVDFKTDMEDPQRALRYRRQVGWYVRGLELITNERPVGWLLHL
jgi:ATP-dependent exoDNAse (exonuclease V) beta subunit